MSAALAIRVREHRPEDDESLRALFEAAEAESSLVSGFVHTAVREGCGYTDLAKQYADYIVLVALAEPTSAEPSVLVEALERQPGEVGICGVASVGLKDVFVGGVRATSGVISDLRVQPGFRRSRVAAALLADVEQRCRQRGVERLYATVGDRNVLRALRREGFEVAAERRLAHWLLNKPRDVRQLPPSAVPRSVRTTRLGGIAAAEELQLAFDRRDLMLANGRDIRLLTDSSSFMGTWVAELRGPAGDEGLGADAAAVAADDGEAPAPSTERQEQEDANSMSRATGTLVVAPHEFLPKDRRLIVARDVLEEKSLGRQSFEKALLGKASKSLDIKPEWIRVMEIKEIRLRKGGKAVGTDLRVRVKYEIIIPEGDRDAEQMVVLIGSMADQSAVAAEKKAKDEERRRIAEDDISALEKSDPLLYDARLKQRAEDVKKAKTSKSSKPKPKPKKDPSKESAARANTDDASAVGAGGAAYVSRATLSLWDGGQVVKVKLDAQFFDTVLGRGVVATLAGLVSLSYLQMVANAVVGGGAIWRLLVLALTSALGLGAYRAALFANFVVETWRTGKYRVRIFGAASQGADGELLLAHLSDLAHNLARERGFLGCIVNLPELPKGAKGKAKDAGAKAAAAGGAFPRGRLTATVMLKVLRAGGADEPARQVLNRALEATQQFNDPRDSVL